MCIRDRDYTPGAMRNATKADWRAMYYTPASMGTRCHQLADMPRVNIGLLHLLLQHTSASLTLNENLSLIHI